MRVRNLMLYVVILTMMVFFVGCSTASKEVSKESASSNTASNEPSEAVSAYPEKPVTVIVGFSAGGGTDTAARMLFQYAEKYFGQKFAIVNKPGASGEIAWTELAMSDPDGYTIGFINPPTFLSHPIQRSGCQYELEDFSIIANIVSDPAIIAVNAQSDMNSLDDYFAAAANGDITVGYSGPGSSESLMLRQLEDFTGKSVNKIPFDGSAPSVVALLGGHVDSVCMNVSEAINYVEEGNIKIIGVASKKRVSDFPDVATFDEQKYPIFNIALRGVAGPKGMDSDMLAKIEDSIYKASQDPEFLKKAEEISLPIDYLDASDYKDLLVEMTETLKVEFEKGEW
ncbi:tripartite tricarboxylate transporter substrate binding protein [Fusibacter ferrireducens]|uniref:Tripartite tricarboxylate transporter substrate binding protein n=1 Tax=Fusibacter ferrireducens TaxID=2785058 RepID=A0ABR9ZW47_9FIRM|nr:tripartite tricarboxylate transporter substrate binding protein [Fusibacter ferrireducens]MBF4694692.1 tripartite tricarboxylate transporter substrate binding protein [Fusibacter ferrireducens]